MAKTLDEETASAPPPKGPAPRGPEAADDAPLLDDADSAPKGLARRSSPRQTQPRRWPFVLVIVLLVAVSLVQAAGLFYRDQLQGRQTSSSIEEVFSHMAEVVPVSAEARRSALGFGVTQVVVGGAPEEEAASGAQPPAPPLRSPPGKKPPRKKPPQGRPPLRRRRSPPGFPNPNANRLPKLRPPRGASEKKAAIPTR